MKPKKQSYSREGRRGPLERKLASMEEKKRNQRGKKGGDKKLGEKKLTLYRGARIERA